MSRTVITDDNIEELVNIYIHDKSKLPHDLQKKPIRNWDVSKVSNMRALFADAYDFNEDIGSWDVSNVTDMMGMFAGATSFNQPIGSWDVSNVTEMEEMFVDARSFNQPIGSWVVSKDIDISSMHAMFAGATSFSQPIQFIDWDDMDVLIPDAKELTDYKRRVTNVKIARTTEEYMSMCLTADKTDLECRNNICPICLNEFVRGGVLVRPVMFHKTVTHGKEMWSCPVHPEEQLKFSHTKCNSCRATLFIPDDIAEEEVRNAHATKLQSVIRGRRTRRSSVGKAVAKKVRREREYRESRKAFHDSYVKRQQAIRRAAFNAAFPPSRSMSRTRSRSRTRSKRHSANF